MLKRRCTKCLTYKIERDFSYRNKAQGKLHRVCKACQRQVARLHYIENKKDYIVRALAQDPKKILRNKHNSYALNKGYKRCKCCSKEEVDDFIEKRPTDHDIDHILNTWEGGKHCLNNLQYLHHIEHKKKSSRERRLKNVKIYKF